MGITLVNTNTWTSGGSSTVTIALPDGCDVSGRIVFFFLRYDNTSRTFTAPTSETWTQIDENTSVDTTELYYRIIDGTEGWSGTGDTTTATLDGSESQAGITWLFTEHNASTDGVGWAGFTGSSNPDPPSVNTPGTAGDTTFYWGCGGWNTGNRTVTSWPETNNQLEASSGGAGVGVGVCSCSPTNPSTNGSYDQGSYTISATPSASRSYGLALTEGTEGLSAGGAVQDPISRGVVSAPR